MYGAFTRGTIALSALMLTFAIALPSARAQVKPGDTITPDNATKIQEFVAPGVLWKVQHGMSMKITPTTHIDWPAPYQSATEKYADQVRMSPDGRSLSNYVAGQPFPFLDPNDPNVGTKIMWNGAFRPITTDDYDLRYYDCSSVANKLGSSQRVIDYFQIGHYAGYDEVGRTEVPPVPIDPDYKQSNRYWLFALYPVLAPQDLRGAGFVRYRYQQPGRQDDSWSWNPGTRRLRRLNGTIMSDAVSSGAQGANVTTWDPDHYSGFNAKIENYNYKLLGQKSMLAPVNAKNSPEKTCDTDGGASACPENWEMRRMYIVEVTPRNMGEGKGVTLHGKTIVYMDGEGWFEPYVDEYDRQDRLWQNHIYWLTYRDRPVPDARIAVYPFKREFVVGASSTDEQSGMATMCYLPGQHTPERECWYINMGEVNKDFFTTQSMAKSAP